MKLLVLAGHHVHELLTYRECAEVMREALAARARGQIQQPLRTIVRPRDAAGFMALMPAYSPDAGYGLKAICITPGNPAVGKDAHQGGVLLFDVSTGEPRALVNASAVTEIRTAATSAVATDLLARPGAAELAIIGTGVQGRAHAHAIAATRDLTGIRLAGRDLARTRTVAAELAGQLGRAGQRVRRRGRRGRGGRHRGDRHHRGRAGAAPRVAGPGRARERGRRVRAGRPGARHRDDGRGGRLRRQPRVGQQRGRGLPDRASARASPTRSGPNSASCSPAPPPGARTTTRSPCSNRSAWPPRTWPPPASCTRRPAASAPVRPLSSSPSLEKSGDRRAHPGGLRYRGR